MPPPQRYTRDTEKSEKVRDLAKQTGLPVNLAWHVVRGQLSLDRALKLMLADDIRRRLTSEGMSLSIAGQVVCGCLEESKAREVMRAQNHPLYDKKRSCLKEALAGGTEVLLQRFGRGAEQVIVRELARFELCVEGADGQRETLLKHEIKWVLPSTTAEDLAPSKELDKGVADLAWGCSAIRAERIVMPRSLKLDILDSRRPLRVVARDGEALRGLPVWASIYELGLRLLAPGSKEPGPEAIVFYHALAMVELAEGTVIRAPGVPGPAPPAAAPGSAERTDQHKPRAGKGSKKRKKKKKRGWR